MKIDIRFHTTEGVRDVIHYAVNQFIEVKNRTDPLRCLLQFYEIVDLIDADGMGDCVIVGSDPRGGCHGISSQASK